MKIIKPTLIGSALLLAIAAPASAHTGDHSAPVLANIMHWLSSPAHGLIVAAALVIITAVALRRRNS